MPKSKHPEVIRFVNTRALVTALMLVVDYVIPPGKSDSFIFDTWLRVVGTWTHRMREEAMRWANQRRMIASDHIVRKQIPKPIEVDCLPFASKFTTQHLSDAITELRKNSVSPAPDGNYYMAIGSNQRVKVREWLEQDVLDAVSGLPNFARSVLRGAWSILEGHGPEFDDARMQLVGMAFDLANGNKGVDARDLCKYAYHVLDMRLAPMSPNFDNEMANLVQLTERPDKLTKTQQDIANVCGDIAGMLIEKNRAYGDSALDPLRVFSQADTIEQINVRIDDKLSRLKRGSAAGEDVINDLIGYLVLLKVATRRQGQASKTPTNNRSDRSERCAVKS